MNESNIPSILCALFFGIYFISSFKSKASLKTRIILADTLHNNPSPHIYNIFKI